MIVRGQMTGRSSKKRADYLLFYQSNQPIAVIEAKDNNTHPLAIRYIGQVPKGATLL